MVLAKALFMLAEPGQLGCPTPASVAWQHCYSRIYMVAVMRRTARDRETKDEKVTAEPSKPQPSTTADAASFASTSADASFATAKHSICTGLGLIFAVHFYGAYVQNTALMGEDGLVPCAAHVKQRLETGSFWTWPCVWWFLEPSDANLDAVAVTGFMNAVLVAGGAHYSHVMAICWLCHSSIVNAAEASSFYSYGWETQLLETAFLAIFLCSPTDRKAPPTSVVLWLFRWLAFRISIGAGLIKIRGGSCWEQKTCLWYHFETQPVPSPLSFIFHFLPRAVLARGVDVDLFVQLYTPWLVLVPIKRVRRVAGVVQVAFMVNIAVSGNFSVLNHLTIVPALACLDDDAWPRRVRRAPPKHKRTAARRLIDLLLLALVAYLSRPVVQNLLSQEQIMNTSFDPFKVVNTYGAFGSVGEGRYEPVVALSDDGEHWRELDFPCKPTNVRRRPCFSAPYHHRLDWNIWFIGFKPHKQMLEGRERWLYSFLAQLLRDGDAPARRLLDASSRGARGRVARVTMYRYRMAAPLASILRTAPAERVWWTREVEGPLTPPVVLRGDGNLAYFEAPRPPPGGFVERI